VKQQREKGLQADIARVLAAIGSRVYVLGTRRARGRTCPQCGTFVAEHQGTRQTPGLPDLMAVLPARPAIGPCRFLMVEVKVPGHPLTPEQGAFRAACLEADVAHVTGDVDAVVEWLAAAGYLRTDSVAPGPAPDHSSARRRSPPVARLQLLRAFVNPAHDPQEDDDGQQTENTSNKRQR